MKTKTIKLYSYSELSPKAKEKALDKWIEHNDYTHVTDFLYERLHELLSENNIKETGKTELYYSLSSCQGDGACFIGTFEYKKITLYITHKGNYYHSNSTYIEAQETKNLGYHIDELEPLNKQIVQFEKIYKSICKELAKFGYECIEGEDSFESFKDSCEANGYTFLENGTMENE